MPRFYVPTDLAPDTELALPATAARHVQVLRLQPGNAVTLFDGAGGEWRATITHMGRSDVAVHVDEHRACEREAPRAVHLAFGMMAADRLEWLLEKATELGAARLTPLATERCSLRLSGARAEAKHARWQAVTAAACEQCGRNRLPDLASPTVLDTWLAQRDEPARWLLSFADDAQPLASAVRTLSADDAIALLSGPEGGLTPDEETAARAAGFSPVALGPRTLRAETAPLAALATLNLL